MSDPRASAASILLELHRRHTTTRKVWEGPRAGAETALVLGALRRRGTLDAILQAHSTRKLPALKPATQAALRVGLFELLYMDDAPPHAVVNAAVDNALPRDKGFVNAVLRNILRGRRRQDAGADPRRTLPTDGDVMVFRRPVFPDPNLKPAEFLAARGSTATWIARRRLAELGFDRALACLDLQAATPPTFLRRDGAVESALADAGIPWEQGPHDGVLAVPPRVRASDILAACPGAVFQDAVASQVAPFLAPAPGARVLDCCAAPGGKATHLAQLVGATGHVSAWDADPGRLEKVAENASRLALPWLVCEEPDGAYDAVLADAPCSNTGVLARRPEARWRVKERHLAGLAERQLKILKTAAGHVREGGVLVYSTCSLEHEENGGVVESLLAARPEFSLDEARTCHPDLSGGDGGFMARLLRV